MDDLLDNWEKDLAEDSTDGLDKYLDDRSNDKWDNWFREWLPDSLVDGWRIIPDIFVEDNSMDDLNTSSVDHSTEILNDDPMGNSTDNLEDSFLE